MKYALELAIAVIQFSLSFYGFWLVWRVLLPGLPGPVERKDRVAPYVWYLTDPFVVPAAKALHVPRRLISLVALVVVAAVSVGLDRLPGLLT